MEKIKVIYVFGSGHTGSTLASLLLGSHSRVECVGEMKAYGRSIESGRPCNCGKSVAECDYWQSVHGRLGLGAGVPFPGLNEENRAVFDQANGDFIEAVLAVSGKGCFCDSSKSKRRLIAYLDSEVFDPMVLHLVRDPRAVACSNLRKGRSYWGYLSRWRKRNFKEKEMLFDAGLAENKYQCVRYEDLVLQPEATLSSFMEKTGLVFEAQQLELWNRGNHHIAGNHMAKSTGSELRLDRKYIDRLSLLQWAGASALMRSELRTFAYPMSRAETSRLLRGVADR